MDKNVDIDHAVVVDGYGVDGATGLSFWLVRNSWGFSYGEDGYIQQYDLDRAGVRRHE